MHSYYRSIIDLPQRSWDYYFEIDKTDLMPLPFGTVTAYNQFIYNFFERGGKVRIFQACAIEPTNLFRPNHICSVFFLGILLYQNTALHTKYGYRKNKPGYQKFPFIWFLISLFHDNACQKEKSDDLLFIRTVDDLKRHFDIKHDLLKLQCSMCTHLAQSRTDYFRYIREERKGIEHGIAAAILLYDRLVKIRRKKHLDEPHEERLFWDKSLEYDYREAAQAISMHNMWIAEPATEKLYKDYQLDRLINPPKIKFSDFPLFYILAIADTIEPVKHFMNSHPDMYILENILIEFKANGITVQNAAGSTLPFSDYADKVKTLENWLDIEFTGRADGFDLDFR